MIKHLHVHSIVYMYISGMQSIRYFNINNLYVNLKVYNFPVYISGFENTFLFNVFYLYIIFILYIIKSVPLDGIYLYAYTRVFVQILVNIIIQHDNKMLIILLFQKNADKRRNMWQTLRK